MRSWLHIVHDQFVMYQVYVTHLYMILQIPEERKNVKQEKYIPTAVYSAASGIHITISKVYQKMHYKLNNNITIELRK